MDIIRSVTLGVVQGLTEFLPISSTAHLKLVPALLRWPDPGAAATAVMQLGTMAAVIIYFARDIRETLIGMVRAFQPGGDRNSPAARLGMAVLIGTIPICVIGLALKHLIEGAFRSNTVIALTQIVMALGLIVAERVTRKTRSLDQVTIGDGLVVGGAQCLALVPGASRSGSTLIGAFLTGLEREAALRFSFLLSIPAVLLSGVYEFVAGFIKHEPLPPGAPPVMVWTSADLLLTTVVAGIVGYASIAFLLRYLARHSTAVFVVYRILLGIVLLYLISRGLIPSQ